MSPTARLARIVALAASGLLVAGCTDGAGDETGPADPTGTGGEIAVVDRPHFEGERAVVLVAGQPALGAGADGCRDDRAPYWVCDRQEATSYLAAGGGLDAALREARMDLAGGGTSWTVTLRFEGPDRRDLVTVREEARSRGGLVLVLDEQREVLVSAAVPDVERGVIELTGLSKPEAWDTVERLATG